MWGLSISPADFSSTAQFQNSKPPGFLEYFWVSPHSSSPFILCSDPFSSQSFVFPPLSGINEVKSLLATQNIFTVPVYSWRKVLVVDVTASVVLSFILPLPNKMSALKREQRVPSVPIYGLIQRGIDWQSLSQGRAWNRSQGLRFTMSVTAASTPCPTPPEQAVTKLSKPPFVLKQRGTAPIALEPKS